MQSQRVDTVRQGHPGEVAALRLRGLCAGREMPGDQVEHLRLLLLQHAAQPPQVRFEAAALKQNVEALLSDLKRLKPSTSKGIYVKRVTLSTTMGPGLIIDQASLDA